MIAHFVSTAASVSLLILLVLVLRGPVARAFGARAAYALWLAPLLRAILPPLGDWGLMPTAASRAAGAQSIGEIAILTLPAVDASPAMRWLAGLWMVGAVAFLGFHLVRHHRFVARAMARGVRLAPRGVPYDVVASDTVEGPLATGLIHPLIMVPIDFAERFTPVQQRLALTHEMLHHRRGDIWASAAALVVTAALWFNPFAHLALGAFRRDMEAACDSSVLAITPRAEAHIYAETILRSAARPVPRSLCALTSLDELKGRLTMLTLHHGSGRRLAGIALALGFTAAGATLSLPASAQETAKAGTTLKRILIETKSGDRVEGRQAGDVRVTVHGCPEGETFQATGRSEATNGKTEEARIIICGKGDSTPETLAAGLENALGEIKADPDLSPDRKAQIAAKLEEKIREIRAGL